LHQIEHVLQHADTAPKLVAPNGETIELPQSVFTVLRQVIYHMMRGNAVFIIPEHQELTTQEAADFLNVSRPYLIKLLNEDKIPYTTVGTHRRIRLSDLLSYKKLRDAERERGLNEIARISQEFGVYD
jgi:excisionase family DNA binding protein